MNDTPIYDISGIDPEKHDALLDTVSLDADWMLAVHSPGRERHHVLCLWFKDGEPHEFRELLRELHIEDAEADALAKLYATDYAVHKRGITIMGEIARAFTVDATKALDL